MIQSPDFSGLSNGLDSLIMPETDNRRGLAQTKEFEPQVHRYPDMFSGGSELFYMDPARQSPYNKDPGVDVPTYGAAGGTFSPYLNKIAGHESGGNYNALNKGSLAYGKYQFIPSTEKQYMKKLGFTQAQARTPEGQEKMIRSLTDDNARYLRKHGIPVNNETLYAAHQQGPQGAVNIYKGGNVSKRNIASNLPEGMEPTVENWRNYWGNKMS